MQKTPRDTSVTTEKKLGMSESEKRPCRLLIVEDALCIQRSLRTILRNMQVEMDMAEDGEVAIEMAEQSRAEGKPYDLILMDMYMPRMNGEAATRELRQQGWLGPIIAVSVSTKMEDLTAFYMAGCDDYVAKPVTKKKLEKVLSCYLNFDPAAEPSDPTSLIPMREID